MNLIPELLDLVDEKKLGFVQGVNLSFLSLQEQRWVHTVIMEFDCDVSVWKSNYLKEHSKKGELTYEKTVAVLRAAKGKKRSLVLNDEQLRPFFDGFYSDEEMIEIIMNLLEQWKLTQR